MQKCTLNVSNEIIQVKMRRSKCAISNQRSVERGGIRSLAKQVLVSPNFILRQANDVG